MDTRDVWLLYHNYISSCKLAQVVGSNLTTRSILICVGITVLISVQFFGSVGKNPAAMPIKN
jgi:cell division protein FtsW (lipid II flippase)